MPGLTPSPGPTEILLKVQLKYLIFQNSRDYFCIWLSNWACTQTQPLHCRENSSWSVWLHGSTEKPCWRNLMYSLFPLALMFKKKHWTSFSAGMCLWNCCLYSFYWSQYSLAACRVPKRETGGCRNISKISVKLKCQTAHHPLKYLNLILM